MAFREVITSVTNPRVKDLVRLRDRRYRDRSGCFLVEGYRELRRALERPVEMETLFVCPSLYPGDSEHGVVERAESSGCEIVELAEGPFRKASYRDRPEGLLAIARHFPMDLEGIRLGESPLLLVVESIEKPGNLGTMLRTAAAAGVAGVVVADPTTDPFNPNVIRASLGLVFTVPLAVTSSEAASDWLANAGVSIVATSPEASLAHYDADLTGPTAIVVGSEHDGLSEAWFAAASQRVTIPMPGSADSLNAATAAAVVLFEALRQRPRR